MPKKTKESTNEQIADDLTDVELTSTERLGEAATPPLTARQLRSLRREALKRLEERKRKRENESQGETTQTGEQNSSSPSTSAEALRPPKRRKTQNSESSGEGCSTTGEPEARKGFKETLASYWNAIFSKKTDTEDDTDSDSDSVDTQNSDSVETTNK